MGPKTIEKLLAKRGVSTGALGSRDDPLHPTHLSRKIENETFHPDKRFSNLGQRLKFSIFSGALRYSLGRVCHAAADLSVAWLEG